jgi:hypothetical protein
MKTDNTMWVMKKTFTVSGIGGGNIPKFWWTGV